MNPWDVQQAPQQPVNQPYPAMPNAYGLGSQPSPMGAPQTPQVQGFQGPPASNNNQDPHLSATDSGSRGFSPYSLNGEANSRNPWAIG